MADVVVLGGSIAGLAAALDLARRGHTATIVERDPCPGFANGDVAFTEWERRGVPQFLQGHNFSARARNLLLAHIPEAVADLVGQGIEELNIFKALCPEEFWVPEDDELTGLMTRRPAFELALRRLAETEPGVTMRSPASAVEMIASSDAVPRVSGVVLEDGERIEGDVVLDCAGRRSPVAAWLAARGVHLPTREQECDATYYSRYFRLRPDAGLPQLMLFAAGGEGAGMFLLAFPGDHDTFGLTFVVRPDDEELRMLRHVWAWDAAASLFPSVTGWLAASEPITGVLPMASHRNTRRELVVDGRPLALGLLPVGDSLCTTNPAYGWGASMALTYAFAATEAVDKLHDDPVGLALAYDDAVRAEADGVYRESAAMDRLRMYRLTETPIPDDDRDEMERQMLLEFVRAGMMHDPVLGRAFLRTNGLLDPPGAILDNPEVVASARNTERILSTKPPRKRGPDRDELLAVWAAAKPQAS